MVLSSANETKCFNQLEGWRLHFAWLKLTKGDRAAVLRVAFDGAVSIFQKRFSDASYMDDPVVRSTRSILKSGGLSKENSRSSFEILAEKIIGGRGIQSEKPGVIFRDILSLKSMASWSVMDVSRIAFPVTFRLGREREMLIQNGGTLNLKGHPVLCDTVGRMWTPTTLPDETDLHPSCPDILLVCYAPLERAREVAAKSHLGRIVHMTQAFRFVMAQAFLPHKEVLI